MSDNQKTNLFLSLYGRDKREGCIVVMGTIGTDKTTICRMVLQKPENETLSGFPLTRFIYEKELLGAILQIFGKLGKRTNRHSPKKRIYRLIQFLLTNMKEGEFALLVVDDEQILPLSESDQEKISAELEAKKEKLLQVMLIGQVVGGQDLKSSKLEQFYNNEKCIYQTSRDPLKLDEIQKYIEHRLMVVDPTGGVRFSQEALEYMRKHPLGISCIKNLIFDDELTDTYTQHTIETREEFVENAVKDLTLHKEDLMPTFVMSKAEPTWRSKIRQTLLVAAVALIIVSVGTIGFFISHNFFPKKTSIHKAGDGRTALQGKLSDSKAVEKKEQPQHPLLYSHSTMVQKERGESLEQKLPKLEGQSAKKPTVVGKKEQFQRALIYQKRGEFLKAEQHYLELLKRHPQDHEIHNNLASVYQELGNFDGAVTEYRKAINLNPNYSMARNNLGVVLYKKGDLQAAMKEFKVILEANPKDVRCITHLGVLSKKLKHPDRARRFFEEALSIDPTYSEAHYNLAVILEESEVKRAAFHFQKFLDYGTGTRHQSLKKEVKKRLENLSNSMGR